ncbi:MAG: hypothetical protein Q7S00_02675, partial [bacterium]|nr:hypothetical protein [bacterium]
MKSLDQLGVVCLEGGSYLVDAEEIKRLRDFFNNPQTEKTITVLDVLLNARTFRQEQCCLIEPIEENKTWIEAKKNPGESAYTRFEFNLRRFLNSPVTFVSDLVTRFMVLKEDTLGRELTQIFAAYDPEESVEGLLEFVTDWALANYERIVAIPSLKQIKGYFATALVTYPPRLLSVDERIDLSSPTVSTPEFWEEYAKASGFELGGPDISDARWRELMSVRVIDHSWTPEEAQSIREAMDGERLALGKIFDKIDRVAKGMLEMLLRGATHLTIQDQRIEPAQFPRGYFIKNV